MTPPEQPFLLCFLLLISAASAASSASTAAPPPVEPPASPKQPPSQSSKSTLDPKQLRALQSLDIPIFKDPCTSYPTTVTCDSSAPFRHVTSLTLANCSDDVALSNTALKSLSTLTSFTFRNCPITPIRFPTQLATNLQNFTCVSSLNKLTGVFLSRLESLTHLTVTDVSISASGPSIIISNMRSLNTLTLSQTNLSGVLPKEEWHPNLTYIDLSGNNLGGKIPISLTSLENLAHLNLSSNSLNETIPDTIGDLDSLKILSLSSNELTGSIPESLAAVRGLVHLDLGSNQLNGSIPGFLRDVKGLKYLNLEKNNFQGVLPFNASFIKTLEVFKVGENSNLCYNHTVLGTKMKLGIARCDKHGMPISPPPAKDDSDSSDDSSDDDYGNGDEKRKSHGGPSKVVLGVAIALSSIVFLIVFLVCLSRCCR